MHARYQHFCSPIANRSCASRALQAVVKVVQGKSAFFAVNLSKEVLRSENHMGVPGWLPVGACLMLVHMAPAIIIYVAAFVYRDHVQRSGAMQNGIAAPTPSAAAAAARRWRARTRVPVLATAPDGYPFQRPSACPATPPGPRRIPLIIYQTGRELDHDQLALNDAMRKQTPNLTIAYHDDRQSRDALASLCPHALAAYDCIMPPSYKADLWRYCMLWATGGFYLDDMDELLQPLTSIARPCDAHVLVQHPCLDHKTRRRSEKEKSCYAGSVLQISFLGAEKGSPLMKCAMERIIYHVRSHFYGVDVLQPTGPMLLGACFMTLHRQSQPLGYTMHLRYDPPNNQLVHDDSADLIGTPVIRVRPNQYGARGTRRNQKSLHRALNAYAVMWHLQKMYQCQPELPENATADAEDRRWWASAGFSRPMKQIRGRRKARSSPSAELLGLSDEISIPRPRGAARRGGAMRAAISRGRKNYTMWALSGKGKGSHMKSWLGANR